MKLITCIFTTLLFVSLFAGATSDLKISPTFSLTIPFQLSTKVEMPSLHSKLFHVAASTGKIESQILVVHNKPQTFANKFSVERYWKTSREQTKSTDKKENNLGCTRLSARKFRCSRDVAQDGKFLTEALFWNTNNDLVLIRVSSSSSFSETRNLLSKIKIVQDSRIPASARSLK